MERYIFIMIVEKVISQHAEKVPLLGIQIVEFIIALLGSLIIVNVMKRLFGKNASKLISIY